MLYTRYSKFSKFQSDLFTSQFEIRPVQVLLHEVSVLEESYCINVLGHLHHKTLLRCQPRLAVHTCF